MFAANDSTAPAVSLSGRDSSRNKGATAARCKVAARDHFWVHMDKDRHCQKAFDCMRQLVCRIAHPLKTRPTCVPLANLTSRSDSTKHRRRVAREFRRVAAGVEHEYRVADFSGSACVMQYHGLSEITGDT